MTIGKSVIAMWSRTFVNIIVGVVAVRLTLTALGVDDYGLLCVVSGAAAVLAFLFNAMTDASQRYISYSLEQKEDFNSELNTMLTINIALCAIVVAMSETLGVYILEKYITIPPSRAYAAKCVWHASVAGWCLMLLRTPYMGTLVATERFAALAGLGIAESVLKLGAASLLFYINGDLVAIYILLILIGNMVITISHKIYCAKKLHTTWSGFRFKTARAKEMLKFSAWTIIGDAAKSVSFSGTTIVINMICGVAVSAAVGIGAQVYAAFVMLIAGLAQALMPSIMRNYFGKKNFFLFSVKVSLLSALLMMVISTPLLLLLNPILQLWLGDIPAYTIEFIVWLIILSYIDAFVKPMWYALQSTGRIAIYQIIYSILLVIQIPIIYYLLKNTGNPETAYQVRIGAMAITAIALSLILWKYSKHGKSISYNTNI